MSECILEQLDDGWWCPVCDPDKLRLLPVNAERPCRLGGRPYLAVVARKAEVGPDPRPGRAEKTASARPPKMPSLTSRVWNLAEFGREFAGDGLKLVAQDVYQQRLAACDGCPSRLDTRCAECGCYIQIKARARVARCDLGKWPPVD